MKRVLITYGPGSVSIDGARRITNQSTGSLGIFLTHFFIREGWEVIALGSKHITCHDSLPKDTLLFNRKRIESFPSDIFEKLRCELGERMSDEEMLSRAPDWLNQHLEFETTEDLSRSMRLFASLFEIHTVLHLAALSDFEIYAVYDEKGTPLAHPGIPWHHGLKISSTHPKLTIELRQAPKLIASLRDLFPKACIVGWKYVVGGKEDGLAVAFQQIEQNQTDACVLNSNQREQGFDFCTLENGKRDKALLYDAPQLARHLVEWVDAKIKA